MPLKLTHSAGFICSLCSGIRTIDDSVCLRSGERDVFLEGEAMRLGCSWRLLLGDVDDREIKQVGVRVVAVDFEDF